MRLSAFFKIYSRKIFLFSMKPLHKLTEKVTSGVNNSLQFLHGVKELL